MKDTAGDERFRSLSSGVFKTADGCFLFYDTTNYLSFKNLNKWKSQLEKYNPNMVVVVIGTKLDLVDTRNRYTDDVRVSF